MTRITWNQDVNKKFEFGIDHAVFYPENGTPVPWNGLTNVKESQDGGEIEPYYFDGVKYVDLCSGTNSRFIITSYSEPLGFDSCLGHQPVIPGFLLSNQPQSRFGLSYRTKIGNDLGFKIHLVYNALAKESNRDHKSLKNLVNVETRTWTLDTIPLYYSGLSPSAHFIFDTTKVTDSLLDYLYSILYGSEGQTPRLPTMLELATTFESWNQIRIVFDDNGFSTLVFGVGDLTQTKIDGIVSLTNSTRLVATSSPGIYRLDT